LFLFSEGAGNSLAGFTHLYSILVHSTAAVATFVAQEASVTPEG